MITRDDWLNALADVKRSALVETDAISIQEFAKMLGVGRSAAAHRMKRLLAAGKAEATTKAMLRSDGSLVTVPAYRLDK